MPRTVNDIERSLNGLKDAHRVIATSYPSNENHELVKLVGLLRDIEIARLTEELERAKK